VCLSTIFTRKSANCCTVHLLRRFLHNVSKFFSGFSSPLAVAMLVLEQPADKILDQAGCSRNATNFLFISTSSVKFGSVLLMRSFSSNKPGDLEAEQILTTGSSGSTTSRCCSSSSSSTASSLIFLLNRSKKLPDEGDEEISSWCCCCCLDFVICWGWEWEDFMVFRKRASFCGDVSETSGEIKGRED